MKKILLVCNAGMSTSMLVKKMQEAAKKEITEADIILLGPQIRYELDNVKKVAGTTPVEAINMMDYGMMNGKKVLEHALSVIG